MKFIDLTNSRCGYLTVIGLAGDRGGQVMWDCQCDCGATTTTRGSSLRNGHTKSCGIRCPLGAKARSARAGKANLSHGMTGTPTHRIWTAMRARVTNPNHVGYPDYGGRGITICERWARYEHFLEDMGERPEGMSIDRIKSNGNYEPGNCKWASRKEQNQNTRRNRNITYQGKTQCVIEWEREVGIDYRTITARLDSGWTVERALTTSPELYKNRGAA